MAFVEEIVWSQVIALRSSNKPASPCHHFPESWLAPKYFVYSNLLFELISSAVDNRSYCALAHEISRRILPVYWTHTVGIPCANLISTRATRSFSIFSFETMGSTSVQVCIAQICLRILLYWRPLWWLSWCHGLILSTRVKPVLNALGNSNSRTKCQSQCPNSSNRRSDLKNMPTWNWEDEVRWPILDLNVFTSTDLLTTKIHC